MKETTESKEDVNETITETPVDPLQELTELLQLTQANFENYRKQTEKRVEEVHQWASRKLLSELLPVVDNFEQALRTTEQTAEFIQGMQMVYQQLVALLEQTGLQRMETVNQLFDPRRHEAVKKEAHQTPENTIVEEIQPGYLCDGRVIRCAKVTISTGNSPL
jgi:molecular chaperone GrpE